MSEAGNPVASLYVAMAHASRLLDADPALAAEQALEILNVEPKYPPPTLLLSPTKIQRCSSARPTKERNK